jgi:hypothetical protein
MTTTTSAALVPAAPLFTTEPTVSNRRCFDGIWLLTCCDAVTERSAGVAVPQISHAWLEHIPRHVSPLWSPQHLVASVAIGGLMRPADVRRRHSPVGRQGGGIAIGLTDHEQLIVLGAVGVAPEGAAAAR